MRSALLLRIGLTCLLLLYVHGQPVNNSSKCECSKDFIKRIKSRDIEGEPVINEPNVFCPNIEIIITTKENQRKCINPESPAGVIILKNMRRREGGVAMTTAHSQKNTLPASTTTLKI
ncbi:C-X-C motif chemokine 11-like [Aulostomus maculatus]